MIHEPHGCGDVQTQPGIGVDPAVIDSPFPLLSDKE